MDSDEYSDAEVEYLETEYENSDEEDISNLINPPLDASGPVTSEGGYDPTVDLFTASTSSLQDAASQAVEGKISAVEYEAQILAKESTSSVSRFMTPEVAGLIGQANMSFVRGNYDETLRFCKEAIRIAPMVGDPYRTMSEMYDDLGDHERALQLGMIAAAMGTQDPAAWISLGEKASDLCKPSETIYCYSKAVKADPTLVHVYLLILKLYNPAKDKKNIIFTYQKLVKHAPVAMGSDILEYAKSGAQMLHEDGDIPKALALMEQAFERVPESIRLDDVNLIVELYVSLQNYEKALQMISQHCDVTIEAEADLVEGETPEEVVPSSFRVINCTLNSEIPSQIRAKLVIIFIHLNAFHLIDSLLPPLLETVEQDGDLLLDIVEVFMSKEKIQEALNILKIMVKSKNFSQPQVWLHYGDCLRKLSKKEEAVSAYLVVMEKAPLLTVARLAVSELLNDLGRGDEAISALVQDPTTQYLDVGMLFERCLLLKENPARVDEFLAVGRLLLSRHFGRIRSKKELQNYSKFVRGVNRFKETYDYTQEEPQYMEGSRMPTAEEEFELFKNLCKMAFETKQMALLERLACSALGSRILCKNQEREWEIYCLAAISSYFNKDTENAHIFFKNLVAHKMDSNAVWNLFNLVLTQCDDQRRQKYVMRSVAKDSKNKPLSMINANFLFTAGTYKQALSKYLLHFKQNPTPLVAMLIAVSFLHLSFQKWNKDQNALVSQAVGFFVEYKSLRGEACSQEIHYNLGRMNHQLNLLPTAVYHYKQVFETPAPCEMFDLKREAAYNLSLIYRNSKSYDLARYYVQKYITI